MTSDTQLGNSKMTSKRQIYLPEKVMESLNLVPGDMIVFLKKSDDIIVKKGSVVVND